MLQFKNLTPFKGTITLMPDPDGVESLYTIVKGTFELGEKVRTAGEQVPLALKDQYQGEPGQSSIKVASDVSLTKPGTDVLMVGQAHAPGGKQATQCDVSLAIGPLKKTVRVWGDRSWETGVLGARMSPPKPFEVMPLVWEKAFGGVDQTNDKTPELVAEDRNPVGTGFRLTKGGQKELEGTKLPNLEDPKQLITSLKDRPTPAGFGPICPHWQPRRRYAGTYDEAWLKHRAPFLPKDFDPRFFQSAPSDQVVAGYLKGGEPIEVLGATKSGRLVGHLPNLRIEATYRLNQQDVIKVANLDTVLIEPDHLRLVLVWRTVLACDKRSLQVREVEVSLADGLRGG